MIMMSANEKKIEKTSRKKEKNEVYTIEECQSCNMKTKRIFHQGDYVYKNDVGRCSSCDSRTTIPMIFSEPIKSNES